MKITRSFPSLLALAAGFVLASGATRAAPITWEDDLLNVQVLSPNPQTAYVSFNVKLSPNVENVNIRPFPLNPDLRLSIETSGTVIFNDVGSSVTTSFANSTIIKITDLTASPIQNVQVYDSSTFIDTPVIWGSNFLQFDAYNFPNHTISPDQFIALGVHFTPTLGSGSPSPVPEPASLALLGTALLGLGGLTARPLRKTA